MSGISETNFSSIRDTFTAHNFLEFAMFCLNISVDFVCAKMLCCKNVSDWAEFFSPDLDIDHYYIAPEMSDQSETLL